MPYLQWHQERLQRTLQAHGHDKVYRLAELVRPPETGEWRCRVLYDERTIVVEYLPYLPRPVRLLQAVENDTIDYRFKTTQREALEALFARRGKADDVLIVRHGLITDTSIANVACRIDGVWLTPRVPLLEGTARSRLIAGGDLREADITLEAAMEAEKIAVMNALSGFVEVAGGILRPKKEE